ncbi:MAG: peptide deformylase [bacterium]
MIVTYPNEILRKKSEPVKTADIGSGEIKELIAEMRKTIKKENGVGLAAVQIGVLKQVILVEIDGNVHAFINPQIIRKSWKKIAIEEGCLSVPGKNGFVKRSANVSVLAYDEAGDKVKIKAEGLTAIIFQHEIDHTNGILFIDKIWKK